MDYLWVKWLHVVSSTLLFGTGLGIAFFMWSAHRGGELRVIAATARLVVRADACFTAPAVLVQFLSGWWLVAHSGLAWGTPWIAGALALFVFIGLCWLPVLWLQLRARDLAAAALQAGATTLPAQYHRVMRWWFWLGWPAFLSVLAIFWLMVVKPH